jgi:hypothetical protein
MRRLTFRIALLPLAAGAVLTACHFIGVPSGGEYGGCSPQLPAGYRIQASVPVGVLEVAVTDAGGAPLASASVMATWVGVSDVYPKPKCPSMVEGTADANGLVRWERMKTGPYEVYLFDGEKTASASAAVEAGKTTRVALVGP